MITSVSLIVHPQLPGVSVLPLSGNPKVGVLQSVLVTMEPGSRIPLHRHSVHAAMTVVAGSATILSEDNDNGRKVGVGHCVIFEADSAHGFQAGHDGFTFASTNGGIVDTGEDWDIQFS